MRIFVIATLVAAIGAAQEAAAEEETAVQLEYGVDARVSGCPDAHGFGQSVAVHLGYDPFASTGKHAVRAHIRAAGGRLEGSIELVDEVGKTLGSKSLEASPATGPSGAMSLSASALDGQMVLFGAIDSDSDPSTWTLDGTTWTEHPSAGPLTAMGLSATTLGNDGRRINSHAGVTIGRRARSAKAANNLAIHSNEIRATVTAAAEGARRGRSSAPSR